MANKQKTVAKPSIAPANTGASMVADLANAKPAPKAPRRDEKSAAKAKPEGFDKPLGMGVWGMEIKGRGVFCANENGGLAMVADVKVMGTRLVPINF